MKVFADPARPVIVVLPPRHSIIPSITALLPPFIQKKLNNNKKY
jgi:hypothetical protein